MARRYRGSLLQKLMDCKTKADTEIVGGPKVCQALAEDALHACHVGTIDLRYKRYGEAERKLAEGHELLRRTRKCKRRR